MLFNRGVISTMDGTKDEIIKLLQERGEMFTSEIGRTLNISPATISKYLGILEAEGKVRKSKKTPYVYWCIKDNSNGK